MTEETVEMERKEIGMLALQIRELAEEEPCATALLANVSAVLFSSMDRLNWAGFYLVDGDRLTVGPFQGKPACVHIPYGKGVCGTAWAGGKTVTVDDVSLFPSHIVCDADSRSEIVIPIRDTTGRIRAVMDIDSPVPARFSPGDRAALEEAAEVLSAYTKW